MWNQLQWKLESVGVAVMRYGLVVILILIGLAKFTQEEAMGIQPLVAHSPFLAWMYSILSVAGTSRVIGMIEIVTALLIAAYPLSRKMSVAGSVGAVVISLITTSFLFTTPGAVQLNAGISILGAAGQFLIKDLVLLGASVYLAGSALRDDRADISRLRCDCEVTTVASRRAS